MSVVFKRYSRLAVVLSALTFALIVLGGVTRATGSGLSCPDWPLCQGKLIPPLEFHIMFEYFHRLTAASVSLLTLASCAWIWSSRTLRPKLGWWAALIMALLASQVVLGGLTVLMSLTPAIVVGHLATGMAYFATSLTMAHIALRHAGREPLPVVAAAPQLPLAAVTTLALYGQIMLGGAVSSTGSGLACPDFPNCFPGVWLPQMVGTVAIQMNHRFGAALVTILLVALTATLERARSPFRHLSRLAFGLVVVQVALGVSNVLLQLPLPVTAAHLGTAAAMLGTLVTLVYRLRTSPLPEAPRVTGDLREVTP